MSSLRRWFFRIPAVAVLASALLLPSRAHALPLIGLSASLKALYGKLAQEGLDPYRLGIGARAGVTLPSSLYLGGSFDLFFGESETTLGVENSASLTQLMGNIGYDLALGPLTLRPLLGVGLATLSAESCTGGTCISDSSGEFALAPAAEATFSLGLLTLGGEVRYNLVFADGDADAVVLGVGLGLTL